MALANSYWNNNGTHQALADKLQAMIPPEGSISGVKNQKLEKLRKAINCYYDLYNNGLYNRGRSFSMTFFPYARYRYGNFQFMDALYERAESIMDTFVLAAAREQGLAE